MNELDPGCGYALTGREGDQSKQMAYALRCVALARYERKAKWIRWLAWRLLIRAWCFTCARPVFFKATEDRFDRVVCYCPHCKTEGKKETMGL